MRAVAARVGLTPPPLYEQFAGGKAGLLLAVAIEGFGELADALEQAATGQDEPLLAMAEAYWRFASDEPSLYELMFHQRLEPYSPPTTRHPRSDEGSLCSGPRS
jgi:AcrR family transcriptional regulator